MTAADETVPVRPERLVVIAGTGTEVGKTHVGGRLIAALRDTGRSVEVRKPAQSFAADDPIEQTDAALLGSASGEPARTVCPEHRWYPVEMAPFMAADALGLPPIALADLVDEVRQSWTGPAGASDPTTASTSDLGLVEIAGGCWSPLAHDGDCLDFAAALEPDAVVLIADAGLGTLNAVRPAAGALAQVAPVAVFLNRYDSTNELHRRNRAWLEANEPWVVSVDVVELSELVDTLHR